MTTCSAVMSLTASFSTSPARTFSGQLGDERLPGDHQDPPVAVALGHAREKRLPQPQRDVGHHLLERDQLYGDRLHPSIVIGRTR